MNNGASGLRLTPVLCWVAVATMIAALAIGCVSQSGTHRPRGKWTTGFVVTNLVYLETVGGREAVHAVQLNGTGSGKIDSAEAHPGDRLQWINTNDWDFCVVFSRKDNPDQDHKWKFQHISHANVFVDAPKPNPGEKQKIFKYTIIAFEDAPPPSSPPGTEGPPTSTVAVTPQDPFIIIR
jgi:hypothetical protein